MRTCRARAARRCALRRATAAAAPGGGGVDCGGGGGRATTWLGQGGSTGWHSGRTWAGDGVGMRLTAESGRSDMASKHEHFDMRRSTTALRRRRARHELRRALEQTPPG